jgi:4'-phosphopantetheinyl transferase
MAACGRLRDLGEVHVWLVELAAGAAACDAFLQSLSADERERAARFRFPPLSASYILSRGSLRVLLGRYLEIEPGLMRFAYGTHGKPRLAFPEVPLHFNLAHAGGFAVYAFADCEVGVDIEAVRPMANQESIVRRFFSREECGEWLALDASQRDDAFYRCWTRKEAYIKALGGGLSIPLDSFRVSLRPEVAAAPIHAAADPEAMRRWSLYELPAPDGCFASLAVPERGRKVRVLPPIAASDVLELAGSHVSAFPPGFPA